MKKGNAKGFVLEQKSNNIMKHKYTRPWMRPVTLYGLCDTIVFNTSDGEEDDDDSDKTRGFVWEDDKPRSGSIPFWDE